MYKGNNHLPITEKAGAEIVSIPIHPNLSDNEVFKIINLGKQIFLILIKNFLFQ